MRGPIPVVGGKTAGCETGDAGVRPTGHECRESSRGLFQVATGRLEPPRAGITAEQLQRPTDTGGEAVGSLMVEPSGK